MAYAAFTLPVVMQRFGVTVDTTRDLFGHVAPVPFAADRRAAIEETAPLALLMHTEKARSELLVAPILAELWLKTGRQISVYSGVEFHVDEKDGLTGVCDFLIGRPPQLLEVSPPVLVVLEAKRDSIPDGYGQCAAEMVAALRANRAAKTGVEVVYGCITTGSNWRFLALRDTGLALDSVEYSVRGDLDRIFGILMHTVGATPRNAAA